MKNSFDVLFNPDSVAIVGASEDPSKMGHQCVDSLKDRGFKGKVYPVNPNPNIKEVLGIKTYPTLVSIPEKKIDLVIIVVPARLVFGVLDECKDKGVKGAVIITAGFKELGHQDGRNLQKDMAEIADRAGIKIIGPNTFGMVNTHIGLNASFSPYLSQLKKGGIAVISQSGGIAHVIVNQGVAENIGFSKVVGLGNRCNVEYADLLEYLVDDDDTDVILLYIEGIDDPRRFISAAKEAALKKPVVACKVGKSPAAYKPAYSHTGSIAGKYELYEAAFKQSNIISASDCEELLDIAKILSLSAPPKGNRIAVLSFQAGPGIMITDVCSTKGLELPSFSDKTKKTLEETLPPMTIMTNPVDLGFARGWETLNKVIRAVLEDSNIDALIFFMLPHPVVPFKELFKGMVDLKKEYGKPVVMCINSHQMETQDVIDVFEKNSIPVYTTPERAAKALSGLVRYGKVIG
ncbi:MAG: CoA-binding protein [bacterium]|nr:MAG: CoA-binding protein [bacterium]